MPSFRGVLSLNTDAPGAAPPDAFGPFRVLHQIGAGALGPVFRAYQPEQDRLVAVKLFRLDLEPERAHQLVAEFEKLIAADLSHPGIAAPLATGLTGVYAYLAQDFVAAESLDVVIRDSGPASLETAIRVATQLGAALDHSAAAEILHGALHPRDILLSSDDARMTGIGLARALAQVGVPAPVRRPYTAPERVASLPWDQRADVFSLAALIFELLAGKRVSGVGEDAASLLPDTMPSGDRQALRPVFAKALAGNPATRYDSGLAFAQALLDAVGSAKPRREGKRKRFGADAPSLLTDVAPQGEAADRDLTVPAVVASVETEPSKPEPPPSLSELRRTSPSPEPPIVESLSPDSRLPTLDSHHDLGELHIAPPALDHDPLDLHLLSEPTPSPLDDPLHAMELEAVPAARHEGPHLLDDMPAAGTASGIDAPLDVPMETAVREHTPESLAQFQRESALTREDRPAKRTARKKESRPNDAPVAVSSVDEPMAPVVSAPAVELAPETVVPPPEMPDREVEHSRPYVRTTSPISTPGEESSPSRAMWPMAATLVVGIGIGFGLAMLVMDRGRTEAAADRARLTPAPTVVNEQPIVPERPVLTPPASSATATSTPPPAVTSGAGVPPATRPAAETARAAARPEPASAKPAAAPSAGRLSVRSTPAGAAVFVDGKEVGVTPFTARELSAGTHLVRVTHAGYVGVERHVSITDAKLSQSLAVELEPAKPERRPAAAAAAPAAPAATAAPAVAGHGTFVFESRPAGAQVFMDGKLVGTTPLTLESVATGEHDVHIDLQGYRRWATGVTLAAGERHRVAASLEQ